MIPLLLQNKSFKKNFIPFFYVLTLNAQIDKMEPPFGMQVCKIRIANIYFGKILHKIKFLFLMV
jgi:TRAP-type C4-dicarboxylate transport system permease large subunit